MGDVHTDAQQVENAAPQRRPVPVAFDDPDYNMSHPKRGAALIFNHETFDESLHLPTRLGTNNDADELEKTLGKLRFETQRMDNYTVDQIYDVIVKYTNMDHSENDCILIAILTHGDGTHLYARDGKYDFDAIWSAFKGNSCPSLAGKPKLFVLQACQGRARQSLHQLGVNFYSTDLLASGVQPQSYAVPEYADILIAYSTIPGCVSYRDTQDGSWYIQALCKELANEDKADILRILTNVSRRVGIVSCNQYALAQLPHFRSMLMRNLYFK